MNILLLHPSQPSIFPPPGLAYLAATVRSEREDVNVVATDLAGLPDAIQGPSFDIIGISLHSFAVRELPSLLPRLRRHSPKARIIAGGHHPSAMPEQMLRHGFDQVISGPGENALLKAVEGDTSAHIAGEAVDANDLPVPDYSGFGGSWQLPLFPHVKALPVISSRGCPFTCNFCASSAFWRRKWFSRRPEHVIDELRAHIVKWGISGFMFEDDNFTLQSDRAIEICRHIREYILPQWPQIQWQAASRAEVLSDEHLCQALAESGCTHVWLGCESGSDEILARSGKQTTAEEQLKGIETAARFGLSTIGQFIVGLPGESEESVARTISFIQQSCLTRIGVNIAWVLPGTALYEIACRNGFDPESYFRSVPYFTHEHSYRTLAGWQKSILRAGEPLFRESKWSRFYSTCRRAFSSLAHIRRQKK